MHLTACPECTLSTTRACCHGYMNINMWHKAPAFICWFAWCKYFLGCFVVEKCRPLNSIRSMYGVLEAWWAGSLFSAVWSSYRYSYLCYLCKLHDYSCSVLLHFFCFTSLFHLFVWISNKKMYFVAALFILIYACVFVLSVPLPYYSTSTVRHRCKDWSHTNMTIGNSFLSGKGDVLRVYS